jgi:hypothetical protein
MSWYPPRDRNERPGSGHPGGTPSRSSSSYRQEDPAQMNGYYQVAPGGYDNPYTGGSSYDPHHPNLNIYRSPPPSRHSANTVFTGEGSVPLSAVVPGSAFVSREQLDVAHAYGIQREDGSYTRLIRADELSEVNNVPRGQGPEGLIILPSPHQIDPSLRVGPEQMVPREVCPFTLTANGKKLIIDKLFRICQETAQVITTLVTARAAMTRMTRHR